MRLKQKVGSNMTIDAKWSQGQSQVFKNVLIRFSIGEPYDLSEAWSSKTCDLQAGLHSKDQFKFLVNCMYVDSR